MNALAGASVGDAADTDRPITAAAAPVARKERRLCVGDCSVSPLEEEAETAERWLRRHDGRTMTTVDGHWTSKASRLFWTPGVSAPPRPSFGSLWQSLAQNKMLECDTLILAAAEAKDEAIRAEERNVVKERDGENYEENQNPALLQFPLSIPRCFQP